MSIRQLQEMYADGTIGIEVLTLASESVLDELCDATLSHPVVGKRGYPDTLDRQVSHVCPHEFLVAFNDAAGIGGDE